MKSKSNGVIIEDGQEVLVTVSEEEKRNCFLYTGMPVIIENNKVLSNRTKGTIIGFHKNLAGSALCKVHWLEGAPPLMIKCAYVKSMLPRPMWVLIQSPDRTVVADGLNFSTGNGYWSAQRGIHERRYFDKSAAEAAAVELQRRYSADVLIMKIDSVRNASGIVAL